MTHNTWHLTYNMWQLTCDTWWGVNVLSFLALTVWDNPLQEVYYNRNNLLVKGLPPHIHRPSPARWRPVNMLVHPFYQGISSVVTWVPPHIHRSQICRRRPGPHLFPCISMHWTTVFCIRHSCHRPLLLSLWLSIIFDYQSQPWTTNKLISCLNRGTYQIICTLITV